MRSSLFTLTLLALTVGTAEDSTAARPVFGGDVVVTNKTDFAVRVWIRHGVRLVKTARLQPMESVTSPQLRLGNNKMDPSEYSRVNVFARGLEAPIRGRNATDVSSYGGPPLEGETDCYDITTLIIGQEDGEISEDDVVLFDIENGDCDTDPEDPGDDDVDDDSADGDGNGAGNGDGDGETTGQLDSRQEQTVMIASSSGLAFLIIVGCLLGRAPRQK